MTRPGGAWRNWSRSETARPQRIEFPRSVDAVRRAVAAAARAGLTVKAVGAGHSSNAVAATAGVMIDLRDLTGLVDVDRARGRVTVRAGTPLHGLPRLLADHALAMQNLGDIDRQTVAGAVSTGTHGTGARFRGLASHVVGAKLVTADGDLITVDESAHPELLPAVALGLGALGILVEVTLQCVPAFVLHARESPEPLEDVSAALHDRVAAADHFELFWFPHTDRAMTKTNTRLPRTAPRHPLPPAGRWIDDVLVGTLLYRAACGLGRVVPSTVPSINAIAVRAWGDREFTDWSARVFTTRRDVRFHEMEYALPAADVGPAFTALRKLIDERGWRISFPVGVRFAAADDVWLSTAQGRATGYIAVHRYYREDPGEYFEAVEEIMTALGGRPHWGMVHSQDAASLRARYPRFDDFREVRDRLDPDRVFGNAYLERVLGG